MRTDDYSRTIYELQIEGSKQRELPAQMKYYYGYYDSNERPIERLFVKH